MTYYVDKEALALKVQRHLIPDVDVDGTVSVENAERWFLKLLEEAPTLVITMPDDSELTLGELIDYTLDLLRERQEIAEQLDKMKQESESLALIIKNKEAEVKKLQEERSLLKRQYAELYNLSQRLLGGKKQ